jgi:hypothetical protein
LKAEVSPLFAIIFKKSLESRTILEDWQVANNTPMFKKGSKSKEYYPCPVSLTSV